MISLRFFVVYDQGTGGMNLAIKEYYRTARADRKPVGNTGDCVRWLAGRQSAFWLIVRTIFHQSSN